MLDLVVAPLATAASSRTRCSAATPTEMIDRASLAIPTVVLLSFVLWSSPSTIQEHWSNLVLKQRRRTSMGERGTRRWQQAVGDHAAPAQIDKTVAPMQIDQNSGVTFNRERAAA
jgi:hypothetical protein